MKYRIGLDIGIASVGWAVMENGEDGEAKKIIDMGVRIFESAESFDTGKSFAEERREKRGARRRYRRKKHRIDRVKKTTSFISFFNTRGVKKSISGTY